MKTSQKGFTLVELVVVIVLLGILGVTALGSFQNLQNDAELAALGGVASEATAASAINYAGSQIPGAVDGTNYQELNSDADCATVAADLFISAPAGYTFANPDGVDDACAAGTTMSCDLTDANGNTTTADIICTQ